MIWAEVCEGCGHHLAPLGDIGLQETGCSAVDEGMADQSTVQLVLKYVSKRTARGEFTKDTAEKIRSRLLDFAKSTDIPPARITRRQVERWLERPGLSDHYRRARLSALRGFCQWCVLNGHMRKDPTLGIPLPPLPPRLPRSLPHTEAVATVTCASADKRTELMCLLIFQEALRRGEVARIQVGDIDCRKQTISVRGKGGRGHQTRVVPVSDETWRALCDYLPAVPSTGPLFRSRVNPDKGLSPARVGELVTEAMVDAGVKRYAGDGRTPHAGRHTAAQELADAGVDMRVIQRFLGHASIKNTEIYTAGDVSGIREHVGGRTYRA